MKIAYIIPSTIKSGPIKVVHQLVSKLSKEHEIDIYDFKDVSTREHLAFDVPTKKIGFFDEIDFDQYDILHSHTILPDAYLWYHNRKIQKAKTVSTLHNYAYDDLRYSYGVIKGSAMALIWNMITIKHDKLVTLSKSALNYYKKKWFNDSLTYIYNGVDIDADNEVGKKENTNTIKIGNIASAGGINHRKGIDQIIRSLEKLPKEYELYIAGKKSKESQKLLTLAESLKVEKRVHFAGYIADMKSSISAMDIFVVSPRSEGFGLSLIEVINNKKAVVCSDIEIFKEIFTEDEVLFFTLDKIDDLAEKIKECYMQREVLSQKAYRKFIENYTSDIMADNYLKMYESLKEDHE